MKQLTTLNLKCLQITLRLPYLCLQNSRTFIHFKANEGTAIFDLYRKITTAYQTEQLSNPKNFGFLPDIDLESELPMRRNCRLPT